MYTWKYLGDLTRDMKTLKALPKGEEALYLFQNQGDITLYTLLRVFHAGKKYGKHIRLAQHPDLNEDTRVVLGYSIAMDPVRQAQCSTDESLDVFQYILETRNEEKVPLKVAMVLAVYENTIRAVECRKTEGKKRAAFFLKKFVDANFEVIEDKEDFHKDLESYARPPLSHYTVLRTTEKVVVDKFIVTASSEKEALEKAQGRSADPGVVPDSDQAFSIIWKVLPNDNDKE